MNAGGYRSSGACHILFLVINFLSSGTVKRETQKRKFTGAGGEVKKGSLVLNYVSASKDGLWWRWY
jgi:hypothetical protein